MYIHPYVQIVHARIYKYMYMPCTTYIVHGTYLMSITTNLFRESYYITSTTQCRACKPVVHHLLFN